MNVIKVAGRLAGIFACSTLLTVGTIVLIRSMSLDFDSVLYTCKLSITGAVAAGFLGYLIGKNFESSQQTKKQKTKRSNKDPDLLIDDLLIDDLSQVNDKIE